MGFSGPSISFDPVSQEMHQTGMSKMQSSQTGWKCSLKKEDKRGLVRGKAWPLLWKEAPKKQVGRAGSVSSIYVVGLVKDRKGRIRVHLVLGTQSKKLVQFACIQNNKIIDLVVKGKRWEWAHQKYSQYRWDIWAVPLMLFASIIK